MPILWAVSMRSFREWSITAKGEAAYWHGRWSMQARGYGLWNSSGDDLQEGTAEGVSAAACDKGLRGHPSLGQSIHLRLSSSLRWEPRQPSARVLPSLEAQSLPRSIVGPVTAVPKSGATLRLASSAAFERDMRSAIESLCTSYLSYRCGVVHGVPRPLPPACRRGANPANGPRYVRSRTTISCW